MKCNYHLDKVITFCYNGTMTIQKQLQQIMQEAKWSQDDLAWRLDVSPKTLSFWMTKKSSPRAKYLEKIQNLYLDIVGRKEVDTAQLARLKTKAAATRMNLKTLLNNEDLLKATTLYLTYHTNTIEGSTMTIEDVATVLDNENTVISNKSYREQAEARNHRAAFLYLLEQLREDGKKFRWSTEIILEIHKRLMNGLIDDAGRFRNYGVRVLGSNVARANYAAIPKRMNRLVEYLNEPSDDIVAKIAQAHAIFEMIHPFGDGNGRTGRLIMFAQAMQQGIVPPLVLKERKRAYYKYLEDAGKNEDYDLLAMFVAESILAADRLLR